MRIMNITSRLKANTVISTLTADGRKWAYRKYGKDVIVFAVETCDCCGEELTGPNDFTVVNARSFVEDVLATKRIPNRSDKFWLDEGGCDDEGNFVCSSCYEEGEVNKAMLKSEGGV